MHDRETGEMAAIRVREYRAGDGEGLRALWDMAGFRSIGDDDESLTRFAARNPGLCLVAEDAGRIVASALGGWDGRRGWLYHVAAAPGYQRRGLASAMVGRIEVGLRIEGCPRSLVIVEADNEGALAFWAALGYERRGTHHLGKSL